MSTILTGSFTSTGTQFNLAIRSAFDMFQMVNITDVGSAAANTNVMRAWYSSLMPAGSAYRNLKTNGAATLALESMITTAGFTIFDSGNPPTFSATAVTGITAASPAVVASVAHGLAVGDTVKLYGLNGTMQPMSGLEYTVDAVGDADHFTITFDASGAVGGTPTTTGFAQKVIPSPFSPHNIVIGPTATVATAGGDLLLCLNTVPYTSTSVVVNQLASQYSPFLPPYQPGAYVRLYMPTGFGMSVTANFLLCKVVGFATATAGYHFQNVLQLQIVSAGNSSSSPTTATGLAAITYPAGTSSYKSSFPFITDIAETSAILSEAEDNAGIYGITIGTGVQTTGKLYQWFARKEFSI
jgi:hypothetical protein